METPTIAHEDTRRVPGWERVLDAFMADRDRIRTNVELGQILGVQAFHQRLSDLIRRGYVFSPAVKLRNGLFAYALVGIDPACPWPFKRPRPYADHLPEMPGGANDERITAAVTSIQVRAAEILQRPSRTGDAVLIGALNEHPGPASGPSRAERDAASILLTSLGDQVVGDWSEVDRRDVLALARSARDELARVRSLRALENAAADALAAKRDAVATLQDALPEGALADLEDVGRRDDLCALAGAVREQFTALEATIRDVRGDLATALEDRSHRVRQPRQQRAARGHTGPQLMRRALEHHEQPMHSAKIAEWVMANGGDQVYKGKTPAATMAAQLAMSNKEGGEFVKTEPGCYALRDWGCSLPGETPHAARRDEFGNALLELDPIR